MTTEKQPVLSVQDVVSGYDGSTVIDHVSFEVAAGEALLIIGRNGVGKTTLLETIVGLTRMLSGRITLNAQEIGGVMPYLRSRMGVAWVPQLREIFPSLTVEETMRVVQRKGVWNIDRVYELFPRLKERRRNYGSQLSGGEQQMLALGRALVTNPRVLLLDEPVEGLSPKIAEEMMVAIGQMREQDSMAILLVEQKYQMALPICDRVMVLDSGRVVHSSECDQYMESPEVLERFLAPA